jgi:hypothetical protein
LRQHSKRSFVGALLRALRLSAAKRLGTSLHQIEAFLEVSKLQNGGFCEGFEQQTFQE